MMSEASLLARNSLRVDLRLTLDDGLDEFIKKSENPNWWRTVKDELNQKNIEITDQQLEFMRRIRNG